MKDVLIRRAPLIISILILTFFILSGLSVFSGELKGNDDYMRLLQVRDLLGGQGWFDVSQSRLLSPEGGAMHWSRLPDIPLALLSLMFGAQAAAYLWPLCLLALTLFMLAKLAGRLGGETLEKCAVLAVYALTMSVYQFAPGRIDHHGLMVLLSLIAFHALLSREERGRAGLVAGLALAAMLTVAIEGLPFIALAIGAAGLLWVVRGGEEAERLRGLGISFTAAAGLLYLLDAPGLSGRNVCDAFGAGHLTAALAGGLGLAALSQVSPYLRNWTYRGAAGGGLGLIVLGAAALAAPNCLASPYDDLSPLVQSVWLENVSEARSLPALIANDLKTAVKVFGFVLSAFAGAIWLLRSSPLERRADSALLVGAILGGLIMMSWQLRAFSYAQLYAAIAAGLVLARLIRAWGSEGGVNRVAAIAVGMALLMPSSWHQYAEMAAGDEQEEDNGEDEIDTASCTSPEALAPLKAIAPAKIFGPIDLGAPLMAATDHSVFAAPYHRNIKGLERAILAYTGDTETARALISETGAEYLIHCSGMSEYTAYTKAAPEGFAQKLLLGETPDWLEPVQFEGETPVQLYRILD